MIKWRTTFKRELPLHFFQGLVALRCGWLYPGKMGNCAEVVGVEGILKVSQCDISAPSAHLERRSRKSLQKNDLIFKSSKNNVIFGRFNLNTKRCFTDLPEPRLDPPSFAESFCWGLPVRCSWVAAPVWGVWVDGLLEEGLICLAAKSKSGIAFISSACVSSSRRLMSWALYCVRLARFSSQSRSAAWGEDLDILLFSWLCYKEEIRNWSYQPYFHGQHFVSSWTAL